MVVGGGGTKEEGALGREGERGGGKAPLPLLPLSKHPTGAPLSELPACLPHGGRGGPRFLVAMWAWEEFFAPIPGKNWT